MTSEPSATPLVTGFFNQGDVEGDVHLDDGWCPERTVPAQSPGGPVIPHPLGIRLVASVLGASFNISPNSSLPGSSQVTSFLGGIEQWAVYACLLGLIIGGAGLWWGVQNGSVNRTSVSQHKILAAFAGAVIIGAGVFLITWAFNFGTSVS